MISVVVDPAAKMKSVDPRHGGVIGAQCRPAASLLVTQRLSPVLERAVDGKSERSSRGHRGRLDLSKGDRFTCWNLCPR